MTEEKSPFELDDELVYADSGKRFVASIIDGLIIAVIVGVLMGVTIFGVVGMESIQDGTGLGTFMIIYYSGGIVLPWLYSALMESSEKQATLGKMAMKIRVTDEAGNRISFGRATGRHFGKFVSGIILYIGFMMILWDKNHQGLHDKIAKTVVVY